MARVSRVVAVVPRDPQDAVFNGEHSIGRGFVDFSKTRAAARLLLRPGRGPLAREMRSCFQRLQSKTLHLCIPATSAGRSRADHRRSGQAQGRSRGLRAHHPDTVNDINEGEERKKRTFLQTRALQCQETASDRRGDGEEVMCLCHRQRAPLLLASSLIQTHGVYRCLLLLSPCAVQCGAAFKRCQFC